MVNFGRETLLLFPCCAEKARGGGKWTEDGNQLAGLVGTDIFSRVLAVRQSLLDNLKQTSRYISGKYNKNTAIVSGPDIGQSNYNGQYMPAIKRYTGSLYTAVPGFADLVQRSRTNKNTPDMLILSALYGPLAPLDLIQDYNLKISDPLAYQTWKKIFPWFLRKYIKAQNIERIILYFGGSTHYLKVGRLGVEPLLKGNLLKQVIHYEVENGNAYHTPHNHGLLIGSDAGWLTEPKLTRVVQKEIW